MAFDGTVQAAHAKKAGITTPVSFGASGSPACVDVASGIEVVGRVVSRVVQILDRYAPPVRMIKLTERREITPYKWVHPDEDDR